MTYSGERNGARSDEHDLWPGFTRYYLADYRRADSGELTFPFELASHASAGELYRLLWQSAEAEPYAKTRLLLCKTAGRREIAQRLSSFDSTLTIREATRFVEALFEEGWVETA